jgi:ABC-type antimicrobial peptide transport system permease subunit
LPAALLASAVWIGFLMYLNVKERLVEIGALMAIGFAPGKVRRLVLSKALLLGAAGAVVGFALGTAIAMVTDSSHQGVGPGLPTLFKYGCLALSIGVVACILGSWIPARAAAATDPADVLREE